MISRWLRVLFTLFIFLVVVWAVWEARVWNFQARITPWVIGIPTALLLAVALVQELLAKANVRSAAEEGIPLANGGIGPLDQALPSEIGPALEPTEERRRTVNIIGWIAVFALAIWLLGFHVGIPLATALYLWLAGREGWRITVLLAAGIWASTALFFDCAAHVFFEQGVLLEWLGVNIREFQSQVCIIVNTILPK